VLDEYDDEVDDPF
jgi:hypothetical protein